MLRQTVRHRRSTRILVTSLSLASVLLLAGCDSSSPTEPNGSPLVGTYSGTTDEGKAVSVTIGQSGDRLVVTAFRFELDIDEPLGQGCISFSGQMEWDIGPVELPVVGNTFRIDLPDDLPVSIGLFENNAVFIGSLDSPTNAAGTLSGEIPPGGGFLSCGGEGFAVWTAVKQ